VTLASVAVLAIVYLVEGLREALLAALLLGALAPVDLLLVRSLALENARLLARAVVEEVSRLNPARAVASRHRGRVYVAARLDRGDLHLIVSSKGVEGALVENPVYLPTMEPGPARSLVGACGETMQEEELEAVLLDPETGCLRLARGRARVYARRCSGPGPGDVRRAVRLLAGS